MSSLVISNREEDYGSSEKDLKKEISITEEIISKIQANIESIFDRQETDEIKIYNSQSVHRVFSIKGVPELIFKMHQIPNQTSLDERSIRHCYQHIIHAQRVVRTHQLGLLIIPQSKLFAVKINGKIYDIIAQEKLDINQEESDQEVYYDEFGKSLNEAIRQLAVFICQTGHSDVEWRNNPILNNSLDQNGNRKIAIIDIEFFQGPIVGLFGSGMGRGLVRCVNEEQGKIVETVAIQHGIDTNDFAQAYLERQNELEEWRDLRKYYAKKKIVLGNEPVHIDEKMLEFSEFPTQAKKLKEIAIKLLELINQQIAQSSHKSIKRRRFVQINTHSPLLSITSDLIYKIKDSSTISDANHEELALVKYVIDKLVERGNIYKLCLHHEHVWFLQA